MAERSIAICILLFALTFSLYIDVAISRSLTTTATLDVSASIQRTHDVLSFDPQSLQQQQTTTTLSSSLTLSLYPRSAIHKPHHNNYKALTLTRLARDSARVESIARKLQLITNGGLNRSVLNPEAIQTPVTSGASQGSGEYFTRLGVGSPAKTFYMVLDTGSDVIWLQCKPCESCYNQTDPIFDPAGSSSYRPVQCGSKLCSSLEISDCQNGNCLYRVGYGDGSYTAGDFATETVSFGDSGSIPDIAVGCGHDNQGLFSVAAGLIGLGGGSLSLTSQIKATSFSYCLVNRDSSSSSTLEFNSAPPSDSVTAPLIHNPKIDTFFYVGLTGISVGGEMVSIPPSIFQINENGGGGIIVDSGTVVTRLQTQAYNSLRDSFVQMTQNLPSTSGFKIFDTCYDLSSMETVSVPIVSFHFVKNKTLPLQPNNYLIPIDSAGKFCFAFAPTDESLSIIGNVQQMGIRVSYDLANSQVGFSTDKC